MRSPLGALRERGAKEDVLRRIVVLGLVASLLALAGASLAQQKSIPRLRTRPASIAEKPRVLEGAALGNLKLADVRDTDILVAGDTRITGAELKANVKKSLDDAARQACTRILEGMGEPVPQRGASQAAPPRSLPRMAGTSARRAAVSAVSRAAGNLMRIPCSGLAIRSFEPRKVITGSPIAIHGCGFQDKAGEVLVSTGPQHLALGSDGRPHMVPEVKLGMAVVSWSDTLIHARMRAVDEGQGDAVRYLIVKTAAGVESPPSDSIWTSSGFDKMTLLSSRVIDHAEANPATFDFGGGDCKNGWIVDRVEVGCDYLTPNPSLVCFVPGNAVCWNWEGCQWPAKGTGVRSAPTYADTHISNVVLDWKTAHPDDAIAVVVRMILKGPRGTEPEVPGPPYDWWPW